MNKVNLKAKIQNLNFFYGQNQVLKNISFEIEYNTITALIGPSGCGKTTLLRCFNRMHDLYPNNTYSGAIYLADDETVEAGENNILDKKYDPMLVRSRIGMVFQKPNPFPKSIYENISYGIKLQGETNKKIINEKVEKSLKQAALWDEVKDRLNELPYFLSGGQQQRLCLARTLAQEPELILFDEPTSALDPVSTHKIEELIIDLKKTTTILIVTHNMQQAKRISDQAAFMYLGEMMEIDESSNLFNRPKSDLCQRYISGHFG